MLDRERGSKMLVSAVSGNNYQFRGLQTNREMKSNNLSKDNNVNQPAFTSASAIIQNKWVQRFGVAAIFLALVASVIGQATPYGG